MSEIPHKFDDVLSQLNILAERGTSISGRVSGLKNRLRESLEGLNDIAARTAEVDELIKRLKRLLSDLQMTNQELQNRLAESRSDFEREMGELESRHRSELEQLRNSLASEKAQLESSFMERANMSQAEKESALQAIEKASREQAEAIEKAHVEERNKLVSQYEEVYDSLIQALTRIAERQADAINQIDGELRDSEGLTTEFASVQKQIIGLLASISELLNDTSGQNLPPPPPSVERQRLVLPVGSQGEELEPKNLAPAIDLDDFENLEDLKNSTRSSDKFEYMMKILKLRYERLNQPQKDTYNWKIDGPFKRWTEMSSNPEGKTNQQFLDQKTQVYENVKSFFNSTVNIEPLTEEIELQVGGRRTRRHRKVHFRTRGKKGGRSGKKGGKRGKKTRNGGKRSGGGKRSRKH